MTFQEFSQKVFKKFWVSVKEMSCLIVTGIQEQATQCSQNILKSHSIFCAMYLLISQYIFSCFFLQKRMEVHEISRENTVLQSSDILRRPQKFEKISHFLLTILSNLNKEGCFFKFCGLLKISELYEHTFPFLTCCCWYIWVGEKKTQYKE